MERVGDLSRCAAGAKGAAVDLATGRLGGLDVRGGLDLRTFRREGAEVESHSGDTFNDAVRGGPAARVPGRCQGTGLNHRTSFSSLSERMASKGRRDDHGEENRGENEVMQHFGVLL